MQHGNRQPDPSLTRPVKAIVLGLLAAMIAACAGTPPEPARRSDPASERRLEIAREDLQPFAHALDSTRLWQPLSTHPRGATTELRLWRTVGDAIYALSLRASGDRVDLRMFRLAFCTFWLPPATTGSGSDRQRGRRLSMARCQRAHEQRQLGWHSDDSMRVYDIVSRRHDRHSPALAALWQQLQAELEAIVPAPARGCAHVLLASGEWGCILSTGTIYEAMEWSGPEGYHGFAVQPDSNPIRARHHHRMLAAIDAYLGGHSDFQPVQPLPEPPAWSPRDDCQACPDLDRQACADWLVRARREAFALLPQGGPPQSVLRCDVDHLTASFPIPDGQLSMPASSGAPPHPGARHYAHVRFRLSDGLTVCVRSE